MTRMAPKPTGSARVGFDRRGPAPSREAVLVWRVGRSGSLRLALSPSNDGRELDAELRFESRTGGSTVVSMQLCGSAHASLIGDEHHLALRFERGDEPVVAEIGLIRRDGCPDVLVLTDLPARLGLRGGTYLLDPASGASCLDALATP